MTRNEALQEIRRLAEERSNLRFTAHALERAPKLGKLPITERQAVLCLQKGFFSEQPSPDIKLAGGWKFTMQRNADDIQTVVAGVLVPGRLILVVTGYENCIAPRRPAGARRNEEI